MAAVVAALAVIKVSAEAAMDKTAAPARCRRRAVRARAARRHRPAQRAGDADVHGADAERREPEPGHLRAADGHRGRRGAGVPDLRRRHRRDRDRHPDRAAARAPQAHAGPRRLHAT